MIVNVKGKETEEVYQIKQPWEIYSPVILSIDSVCAKESLKLEIISVY